MHIVGDLLGGTQVNIMCRWLRLLYRYGVAPVASSAYMQTSLIHLRWHGIGLLRFAGSVVIRRTQALSWQLTFPCPGLMMRAAEATLWHMLVRLRAAVAVMADNSLLRCT